MMHYTVKFLICQEKTIIIFCIFLFSLFFLVVFVEIHVKFCNFPIRKLFKSSRYIFNINVLIKTDKKDYDTKIAGKVKNSLVTVDNEVIPIIEINDIIIKDRL